MISPWLGEQRNADSDRRGRQERQPRRDRLCTARWRKIFVLGARLYEQTQIVSINEVFDLVKDRIRLVSVDHFFAT